MIIRKTTIIIYYYRTIYNNDRWLIVLSGFLDSFHDLHVTFIAENIWLILVGGLEHVLFSFFRGVGCNHQPDVFFSERIPESSHRFSV